MQSYYDKVAIFQQFVTLQEYRLSLPLNPYLEALFQLSELTIKAEYDKSCKRPNAKLPKYKDTLEQRYIQAYQSLTSLERLDLYIRQIKCVKEIVEQNAPAGDNVPLVIEEQEAYTLSYSLHIWRKKELKLKHYQGILEISRDKRTKEYDLRNYMLRESKNSEYICFVLESINNKVTEKNRVVRVGFKSLPLFQEWFLAVKATIIRMERERLNQEIANCPNLKIMQKQYQATPNQQVRGDSKNNKEESSHILNNSILSEGSDITVKTIVQTLLDNSQSEQTIDELQGTSFTKKHMNMFSIILPQYRLDSLPQTYFHQLIHSEGDMKIYRNNDNPQRYKVFIPTPETDAQNIVKVLFNVESYSDWNPAVEQSSIKSIISSENMVIISQKHRQYNTIYRARDFVYLRHVFSKDNTIYMVDKSITNITYPSGMLIVRGNIGCIWGVMKQEQQHVIVIDVMIQNEGLINAGQDHNLAMQYLKGLLNLKEKIEKSRNQKSLFTVFDLDWRIDNAVANDTVKLKSNNSQSPPTIPFKGTQKIEQKPSKTGYQKKRRETIQEQQQRASVDVRKRIVTVQQRTEQEVVQKQESAPLIKIPITSIHYQFDAAGEVIIPQDFVRNRYLLTPSAPKEPLLQEIVNGHAIWKGEWKFNKAGGIIFINQTKIEYQKGVFKYVLGKIAKNILSGKSILHISLPVDIFAPETNLERFAFSMTYAPLILEKAFKQKASLEKFKHVIAYGLTNSVLYLNMEKPFNPILGETFQGWINGCPIYLEQISHHPPIASFLFLGRGYKITGSLESKVEMQMNSGCGITDGVYRIMTDDGADFNFITPGGEISGLTIGERKFNLVGKYYVWSKRYQLFVEIKLDPTNKGFFSKRVQPSDYMEGNILEVTRQFIEDFELMKKKDTPSKQHIIHDLGKASGIWSKILLIDGQTYLDLDKEVGCKLQYDGHLLPSDGNWREDVAYKRGNDNVKSQSEKERLEVIQRNDRKLREKLGGHKH